MSLFSYYYIMANRAEWRKCLVTYSVTGKGIKWNILWALSDQHLEGLNLMLAWRTFLSGTEWVPEEDINILSYVDLYKSGQEDLVGMENIEI